MWRQICHDECGIIQTMVFLNKGSNVLPRFLYAEFYKSEMLKPTIRDVITADCKIIIDKWDNTTPAFSGTFSSNKYIWIFYWIN
ncbi:MAG: hypothetical protein ACM3Q2_03905 [Syntrophothermus sp.]